MHRKQSLSFIMEQQKDLLKIGIIGGGLNSAVGNTHRIALQMDNRWRVVAGCFSRNPDINAATRKLWDIHPQRLYDNWRELLANESNQLDAVCVLTPTNYHTEIVIAALDQGLAVICEKALAASCEDAMSICQAAERNKGFLAVTFNYTGYPMIRELQRMIHEGELGKLFLMQLEMPQEGYIRLDSKGNKPKPQDWRLHDGEIPTISLDLGIHLHHMAHFLSGEHPLEVIADQDSFGHFKQVVDNIGCLARYSNGLKCQFWYGKAALGHRNGLRIRVYGEKASAEWYQMQPEDLLINDQFGSRRILDRASMVKEAQGLRYNRFKSGHPAGFIEAFANLYSDIADDITNYIAKGERKSPYVFNEIIASDGLSFLLAINRSKLKSGWEVVHPIFRV